MSFSADVKIGETPLVVQFTDTSVDAVAWEWDFGDGSTSEEQSPEHSFYVEGAFTVVQTVTYADETQDVTTYVGFIIALPGETTEEEKCLRFATEANEGQGWSEFTGTHFVRPMNNFGAFRVLDDSQNDRVVCVDKTDYRLYEIDTCDRIIYDRPAPVDKESIQNAEISWEKWEYQTTFDITEQARFISHDRSYTNVAPEDNNKRGAVGYTAGGLRNAQQLTLKGYLNGQQISPDAQAEKYPVEGEIVFSGVTLKGNQVQMVHCGTASEIIVMNHIHHFLGSNEAKSTADRTMNEHTLQKEIATDLLVNVGRSYSPLLNKVTGSLVGTAARTTGPDGRQSGFICGAVTLDNSSASLGYTLVIWIKSGTGFTGVADMLTQGTSGGWTMKYKRGGTFAADQAVSAGTYAYIRIYNKQLSSDALEYIYNDILAGGRGTC
jgi:hypothetical protein